MSIPWELVCAYGLGLLGLYMIGKLMVMPSKWLWRLVLNSLVGALILWLINLLAPLTSFSVAVNPITLLITGLLGIPGVALVVCLTLILGA